MTVEIYNTLSRRKQALEPLEPGHVRMYVCGVTTYDRTHIGHGRTFVAFDVMQRWLRAAGYRVTYVRTSPTSTTRSSSARPKMARRRRSSPRASSG